MATWVYFAAPAQANEADTIAFAVRQNVLWRSARASSGNRIAYVGRLEPGDTIVLVYGHAPPHIARVAARIAKPARPVPGTNVIELISPPYSDPLIEAGYRPLNDRGEVEVIHLEDVIECKIPLRGNYPPQGAIRPLAPEDAKALSVLADSTPAAEPEEGRERAGAVAAVIEDLSAAIPAQIELPAAPFGEDIEIETIRYSDTAARPLFDAYVMVDWSSRMGPALGPHSIWIAWGWWDGAELREAHANEATRAAALRRIRGLLSGLFAGRRVLLGFDFAFGYPRGFANALRLSGQPWKAVLDLFGGKVEDDDGNHHNRDTFAAWCNAQINGGEPGPFWGCQGGAARAELTTRRVGVFNFPYAGLEEYRETERRAQARGIQPQSVWKLNQGVAVGGQTILGIRYLAKLRFPEGPETGNRMAIWPFETGWQVPGGGDRVVVAEIFPSVLPIEDDLAVLVRDLAQVRTCVRHAAAVDACGRLDAAFHAPKGLSGDRLAAVAEEEGWILFVQ
jgi:hypothetical protein